MTNQRGALMSKQINFHDFPRSVQLAFPFLSIILSGASFWYVFYLVNQESLQFIQWIRLIIFALIGVILLLSAIIFIFHKALAWKGFIFGLSLLPVLLCLQLCLFIITIIRMLIGSIFQGQLPEPIRMFIENYPSKYDVAIIIILLIVGFLVVINKLNKKKMKKD